MNLVDDSFLNDKECYDPTPPNYNYKKHSSVIAKTFDKESIESDEEIKNRTWTKDAENFTKMQIIKKLTKKID